MEVHDSYVLTGLVRSGNRNFKSLGDVADLLTDGRHQVPVAVTQSRHGTLLLLLVQHFELVLGQGLSWLGHHLNHVQDQNLSRRNKRDVFTFTQTGVARSGRGGRAVRGSPDPCR